MEGINKSVALFFTRGLSLEQWETLGMLKREAKLYQHLASHFRTIYIYTYGSNRDKLYTHLFPNNVCIIPKPSFIPVLLYSFIMPFIHRKTLRDADILKTNQMDGSWTAVIVKKLYHKKLVIRCGYEWLQFIKLMQKSWFKKIIAYQVERFAYRNADAIIQTAIDGKNFVIEHFGIPSSYITLIPNFADIETFTPTYREKDSKRVVFVGRFEEQKNIPSMIHAVAGLPITLVMIGDGSMKEELMSLANELGVSVEWKGKLPQKDIALEFNRASIYLLPSLYEGHPKTLLEAMSAGLACVGSNVSGIRDIIIDGKDGLLCGIESNSIRKAVKRLLGDDSLRSSLGAAARQKVIEMYSIDAVVKIESALYHSLLS